MGTREATMSRLRWTTLVLLAACSGSPTGPSTDWLRELHAATRRWQSAAIADYRYTYTRSCFCPPQVLDVTVQDGVVPVIRDVTADTLYQAPLPDYSVPGLFAELASRIESEPDQADIQYHATRGYPLAAMFNPILEAYDEEGGFQVSAFTPDR